MLFSILLNVLSHTLPFQVRVKAARISFYLDAEAILLSLKDPKAPINSQQTLDLDSHLYC